AGRRVMGQATLDAAISGTRDSPSVTGDAKLTNAEFQDYVRGVRVTQIAANAQFKGKTLEIVDFSGRAGAGTIRANGTIDLPSPAENETEPSMTALDLTIASSVLFFVRGRGLDAELEGTVHIGGTLASPNVTGGFDMRRGTFDLGAATLNFTTGKVTFASESL